MRIPIHLLVAGLLLVSPLAFAAQTVVELPCGGGGLDKGIGNPIGRPVGWPQFNGEGNVTPVLEVEGAPSSIQMTWTPSSEVDCDAVEIGDEGYRVYRHDGDGAWYVLYWHVPAGGSLAYEDHVQTGDYHCYQVVAIHAGVEGSKSNEACATAL